MEVIKKKELSILETKGIILYKGNSNVEEGIEQVKGALKPVLGPPKIHINKDRCKNFIKEIGSGYRIKNNKIVKENDHACDDTRYFVMWKIAKQETRPLKPLISQKDNNEYEYEI